MNCTENIVKRLREARENTVDAVNPDYRELKRNYSKSASFSDKDKESGKIRDLTDDLDNKGIEYEIYNSKKDNGCTVFYESVGEADYIALKIDKDENGDYCLVCHDRLEDEEFEKYIGKLGTPTATKNASLMMRDSSLLLSDELKKELIDTFM